MSTNISKHQPGHSLAVLQASLRRSETIRGRLKALRAEGEGADAYTIGEHDELADPTPRLELVVLDAQGNGTVPAGKAIQFKGEGWVAGAKTALAACR